MCVRDDTCVYVLCARVRMCVCVCVVVVGGHVSLSVVGGACAMLVLVRCTSASTSTNCAGSDHAVVLSPITHAMEMNMQWNAVTRAYEVGMIGTVTSIPAGYTAETILYLAPNTVEECAPCVIMHACPTLSSGRGPICCSAW
jgi:hypothetical protein